MTTPPPEKASPSEMDAFNRPDSEVKQSNLAFRNRDGGDSKEPADANINHSTSSSSDHQQVNTPASLTTDQAFSNSTNNNNNTTTTNDNDQSKPENTASSDSTTSRDATATPAQPATNTAAAGADADADAESADKAKPELETAKNGDAPASNAVSEEVKTEKHGEEEKESKEEGKKDDGNAASEPGSGSVDAPVPASAPAPASTSTPTSEIKPEQTTEQSAPAAAGSAPDEPATSTAQNVKEEQKQDDVVEKKTEENAANADGDTIMTGMETTPSQPTSLKRSADEMESSGDAAVNADEKTKMEKQQTPPESTTRDVDMTDADNFSPGTKVAIEKGERGDEPAAKRAKVEGENDTATATATTPAPAISTPARATNTATTTAAATAESGSNGAMTSATPAEQLQTPAPVSATPAAAAAAPPAQPITTPGSTIKPEIKAHTSSPMTKLQHRFLVRCISGLKRLHDARFYKDPVDPVKMNIPSYFTIVTHPMDMSTIEQKLKGGQYEKVDDVIADFDLMVNNAVTFNGIEHPVAIEGVQLRATFNRHLSKLPGVDEVEPPAPEKKRPGKKSGGAASASKSGGSATKRESRPSGGRASIGSQSQTFALSPDGLPLIRRDSTAADGRPKRSIHPPKNRDLPYSAKPKRKKYIWELKFCQEALDEMYKNKYVNIASAFYQPVDPVALNIPNYHSIIKKPMDLSTISSKLKANIYENAKEFEADVRLMFKNCYKFNINGDPVYTAGQKLNEVFDKKWATKDRWLHSHAPPNVRAEHDSAAESDEEVGVGAVSEEENEESEGDVDEEKLAALRRQMEELTKQVEVLSQKKKKTPPASKKKGTATSSSKAPRTSGANKKSTGAAAGKSKKAGAGGSATGGKKEKAARWVSYQEKQLISNVISTLPEKQMNEALSIIQRNAPSLIGSSADGEIELDIDELPNEVLLKLLNFVKKHAPQAVAELEDSNNPPSYSHHSHATTESEPLVPALAGNGRPRKNKPMNASEQEAQINRLEDRLEMFKKGGGAGMSGAYGGAPATAINRNVNMESSDDEDSEESEEE
ncbi:Bromodomain protein [Ascosphaera apis ARSEF 7405]|uniref:Bromodomain protein n=1 Tax=Ascosphaera apis ARSEF 7405 TaxID=392613 RepID=A0A167UZ81_9EURO|nr:Bromodomain protein [Ascosphaera apis ARSEF 7405]